MKQMLIKVCTEFYESDERNDFGTRIMFSNEVFRPKINFFIEHDKAGMALHILNIELGLAMQKGIEKAQERITKLLKDEHDSHISVLQQSAREANEVEHQ